MQIFDVIIFFKLRTIQQKTVKPTYLCPLGARKLVKKKKVRRITSIGTPRHYGKTESVTVHILRAEPLVITKTKQKKLSH